jgi:hypothetical protein
VYRYLEFDPAKNYYSTLYTKKEGTYPDERYFTTNKLKFVGKFLRETREGGYGDGGRCTYHFTCGSVKLDYGGKTCFVTFDD